MKRRKIAQLDKIYFCRINFNIYCAFTQGIAGRFVKNVARFFVFAKFAPKNHPIFPKRRAFAPQSRAFVFKKQRERFPKVVRSFPQSHTIVFQNPHDCFSKSARFLKKLPLRKQFFVTKNDNPSRTVTTHHVAHTRQRTNNYFCVMETKTFFGKIKD